MLSSSRRPVVSTIPKTDAGSPKPISTPLVSQTKILSNPSRIPPVSCFQTIVTVKVGVEKKAFLIHKDLLIFYSEYFRGAFGGSFSEAAKGQIFLADERVDVFTVVIQFIYTRQLSDKLDADLDWEMLVRAWLFGDKYLVPSLQNRVMSALIEKNTKTKTLPTSHLKFIYDNTITGSPLRKIMVDLAAYRSDVSGMMGFEGGKRWPHEALVDLVKALAQKKEGTSKIILPEASRGKCQYHVHAAGENCDTQP